MVWYRSEEARQRHVSDQGARQIMRADEVETFAGPVRDVSFIAHETVLAPSPTDAAILFRFIVCDSSIDRAAFVAHWREVRGPRLADRLGALAGYVQNHGSPGGGPTGFGLACDCIEEFAVAAPEAFDPRVLGDVSDARYVSEVAAVWTRAVLLHQAEEPDG
jgi:hypothetical protein